jgi:hypothetical protein
VAGAGFEPSDLLVMSQASYQAAPSRGGQSNTPTTSQLLTFQELVVQARTVSTPSRCCKRIAGHQAPFRAKRTVEVRGFPGAPRLGCRRWLCSLKAGLRGRHPPEPPRLGCQGGRCFLKAAARDQHPPEPLNPPETPPTIEQSPRHPRSPRSPRRRTGADPGGASGGRRSSRRSPTCTWWR